MSLTSLRPPLAAVTIDRLYTTLIRREQSLSSSITYPSHPIPYLSFATLVRTSHISPGSHWGRCFIWSVFPHQYPTLLEEFVRVQLTKLKEGEGWGLGLGINPNLILDSCGGVDSKMIIKVSLARPDVCKCMTKAATPPLDLCSGLLP